MAGRPVGRAFAGKPDSAETASCSVAFGLESPPGVNLAPEETVSEAAPDPAEPLAGLESEAVMDLAVLPADSDRPAVVRAGPGMPAGPVVGADRDRAPVLGAVGPRVRWFRPDFPPDFR